MSDIPSKHRDIPSKYCLTASKHTRRVGGLANHGECLLTMATPPQLLRCQVFDFWGEIPYLCRSNGFFRPFPYAIPLLKTAKRPRLARKNCILRLLAGGGTVRHRATANIRHLPANIGVATANSRAAAVHYSYRRCAAGAQATRRPPPNVGPPVWAASNPAKELACIPPFFVAPDCAHFLFLEFRNG